MDKSEYRPIAYSQGRKLIGHRIEKHGRVQFVWEAVEFKLFTEEELKMIDSNNQTIRELDLS